MASSMTAATTRLGTTHYESRSSAAPKKSRSLVEMGVLGGCDACERQQND